MDCLPPDLSCEHSSPTPNGDRVGSVWVWIATFRFLNALVGFFLFNGVNTVWFLLFLTKGPAGVGERWRICRPPTAPACLHFCAFLSLHGRPGPSAPNKGHPWLGGGGGESGYCSVGNLTFQPDHRPGPSSRQRRDPAEARFSQRGGTNAKVIPQHVLTLNITAY